MYKAPFDPYLHREILLNLLGTLANESVLNDDIYRKVVKRYPQQGGRIFSKDQLVQAAHTFEKDGVLPFSMSKLEKILKVKPVRTGSGVAPLTVLTKPFPCPGKCIFCPNDVRMPKSYLHDEPGAQRAERNQFDPYLQTYNRLQAYKNIGHDTDKVEIIVLGGTWSFYPESYQIWFIKRCFEALNDFGIGNDQRSTLEKQYQAINERLGVDSRTQNKQVLAAEIDGHTLNKSYNQVISELYTAPDKLMKLDANQTASWDELKQEHLRNENAKHRCVGLVIETRPDNISEAEVIRVRKLGCTKTQIGIQSLQDDVLDKNKRGHNVAATRKAFQLLRQAGFKIHAHWMPNLYGSHPKKDVEDFEKLFADEDFKPDELKIYPCSLIQSAELMQYFEDGRWTPYTHEELLYVLTECLKKTPEYCRLTRVIRDIPSTDIVQGNKKTNFREIAESELARQQQQSKDIRAREIKNKLVSPEELYLDELQYETSVSTEYFLQYIARDKTIAGFLRLSLPKRQAFIDELKDSAMIREVHVYGQLATIGSEPLNKEGKKDRAQHLGLGKKLIERAKKIAKEHQFHKLQVISAIGTRDYYRKQDFQDGDLYQFVNL